MENANLIKLGLKDREQEVYLAVVKAGKISPGRISLLTDINRTTVYSIGKKLVKLGLISEDFKGKTGYFYTEGPEQLLTMINKQEKALAERKSIAQNLVEELKSVANKQSYSVPKIKFIEEEDLNEYLYKQYPIWVASMATYDNTWRGYQDNSFTEDYHDWLEWTWQTPNPTKGAVFVESETSAEKKLSKKHPDRFIKVLPASMHFDTSLWVGGDYLIMVQTRQKPHYLVEINDAVLARNQRELFKNIWQLIP